MKYLGYEIHTEATLEERPIYHNEYALQDVARYYIYHKGKKLAGSYYYFHWAKDQIKELRRKKARRKQK